MKKILFLVIVLAVCWSNCDAQQVIVSGLYGSGLPGGGYNNGAPENNPQNYNNNRNRQYPPYNNRRQPDYNSGRQNQGQPNTQTHYYNHHQPGRYDPYHDHDNSNYPIPPLGAYGSDGVYRPWADYPVNEYCMGSDQKMHNFREKGYEKYRNGCNSSQGYYDGRHLLHVTTTVTVTVVTYQQ